LLAGVRRNLADDCEESKPQCHIGRSSGIDPPPLRKEARGKGPSMRQAHYSSKIEEHHDRRCDGPKPKREESNKHDTPAPARLRTEAKDCPCQKKARGGARRTNKRMYIGEGSLDQASL
jgi:hypothetical protein